MAAQLDSLFLTKAPSLVRFFAVFIFSGLAVLSAAEPLEVTLTQHKVMQAEVGEELVSAESVSPGDIVEYKAVYQNTTDSTLGGVSATVPVPPGMNYLVGSAQPAPMWFSEDGQEFLLLTQIERENGSFREIRSLRWSPQDIVSGGTMEVVLRAQVAPVE